MHLYARVEEKGLRELGEAFAKLERDMQQKLAAQATGAAASVIKKAAKSQVMANPSYETGRLYRSVIAKKIPRSQTDYTSEHIVTFLGRSRRPRKLAKGQASAPHAVFLEFGTVNMPAEPILRPAFDNNAGRAKDIMISKLRAGIEKASK